VREGRRRNPLREKDRKAVEKKNWNLLIKKGRVFVRQSERGGRLRRKLVSISPGKVTDNFESRGP